MATRLRPLTLSPAHYVYLVATLLLLGGVVGMGFHEGIRRFYAEYVTLPPLAREFGFSCREDPSWGGHTITSVVAGGVLDRVGIRAGDHLWTGLDFFLYELDEAHRGRRVQLVVISGQRSFRCAWIDLKDLRMDPAKRAEAVCSDGDTTRFSAWVWDWYRMNRSRP